MSALIGALTALAVLFGAKILFRRRWRKHGHVGWHLDRWLNRIDASEDQRTRVRELVSGLLSDTQGLRFDRKEIADELIAFFGTPDVKVDSLENLVETRAQRTREVGRKWVEALAELH